MVRGDDPEESPLGDLKKTGKRRRRGERRRIMGTYGTRVWGREERGNRASKGGREAL